MIGIILANQNVRILLIACCTLFSNYSTCIQHKIFRLNYSLKLAEFSFNYVVLVLIFTYTLLYYCNFIHNINIYLILYTIRLYQAKKKDSKKKENRNVRIRFIKIKKNKFF